MIHEIKNDYLILQVDSDGAEMISLLNYETGVEYIWQGDHNWWSGMSPLLFPAIGRQRDGIITINGKHYEMPKHGFARGLFFTPVHHAPESAQFLLMYSDKTKQHFPFNFELQVTYTLIAKTVVVDFSVANVSDTDMPFCLGGHPGFNVPINKGELFSDYLVKFDKIENQNCPFVDSQAMIRFDQPKNILSETDTLPLDYSLFENDALIFHNTNSDSLRLMNKNTGEGIRFTYKGFEYIALWTIKKDAPFLCIEPWNGLGMYNDEPVEFAERFGTIILPAGKVYNVGYSFGLI